MEIKNEKTVKVIRIKYNNTDFDKNSEVEEDDLLRQKGIGSTLTHKLVINRLGISLVNS